MDRDGSILERLCEGIVALDGERRAVRFNGRMADLMGWPPGLQPGTFGQSLFAPHREMARLLDEAFRGAFAVDRDLVVTGPEGARHLRVSTTAFPEERGVILSARDVSDVKRQEREMDQVEKMSALGRLSASVAHEVRNPLSAISIQLDLMSEDAASLPEPKRELLARRLSIAVSEIKRMDRIVGNFLRFSRPPRLRLERLCLNDVVRRVFDLVSPEAREQNVQLSTDLCESLPPVVGDENQLCQALLNMTVNAFHAIDGPGNVRAATDVDASSGRVRLTLSDDGCGIAEADLGRVFELYYTTKEEGTGLGLSIAQRIVLDHGGRVEVDSAPRQGTTFRVLLPQAADGEGADRA